MMSRSYTNLVELATGNFPPMMSSEGGGARPSLKRVKTFSGQLSEFDDDDDCHSFSDCSSSTGQERMIIVANQLPVSGCRLDGGTDWDFAWDEDSPILKLKDGFPEDMDVVFVGSLRFEVDAEDQDVVSQFLLDQFNCVPAFLEPDLHEKFYHGFCKQYLWPLFHYMLPLSTNQQGHFDRSLWEAYVSANSVFSHKVVEVLNPEVDYVWIHDYHLMVLPHLLRHKFIRLRLGFFLHSPFPSSEMYRTLPVREDIMKCLLNCDLIGFHTFDYARHFLSVCSRMMGLEYQSRRGYIGLEYYGRTIGIKIMPVGVHMGLLQAAIELPLNRDRVAVLRERFEGKNVLLGVDDMDVFKGINLKLLAFERLLRNNLQMQDTVVLVQIVNPPRSRTGDLVKLQQEIVDTIKRINEEFGTPGNDPVVYIDEPVSFTERIAYYAIAECLVVTAVRDGMNLSPYEYIVCRHGVSGNDSEWTKSATSMLVLSEFIGCSPSLSGAIRVNPWNLEATGEAMKEALVMTETEKRMRHEKHYRYVSTHDMTYWSKSFLQDLERVCKDHFKKRCWGFGIGFGFRVVALDPDFRKLDTDTIRAAYKVSKRRAIFLDYDGTLIPQSSVNRTPNEEIIQLMNALSACANNVVYIVSGRGRDKLVEWFAPCKELGIAAEHGYFIRSSHYSEWETYRHNSDFAWMQMAEPVMRLYTDATDGSYIEIKESALVWHHENADSRFGSSQAKELLDHLESVLANEPVAVKSGQCIVEVKPQGVTKGKILERILSTIGTNGRRADFVLCIGDDRSDEDMFEGMAGITEGELVDPSVSVFACTVGQKPSKAMYYLDDTTEVIRMLRALAQLPSPS